MLSARANGDIRKNRARTFCQEHVLYLISWSCSFAIWMPTLSMSDSSKLDSERRCFGKSSFSFSVWGPGAAMVGSEGVVCTGKRQTSKF